MRVITIHSKLLDLDPKRRDAILNAALKEFSTKGFDDASTNVIAKEAGISKSLMFHYVNSKNDLFLSLYDYCSEIIKNEYFELINFKEKDILERLRQSYILQIELLHKYPWILEFIKVTDINELGEARKEDGFNAQKSLCLETMFGIIDESRFREGLDIERCKQLIYWANVGFTNQILEDIINSDSDKLDYDKILAELDANLNELRKVFYK
jgi:TetR/AcrR family transcriptional regulator